MKSALRDLPAYRPGKQDVRKFLSIMLPALVELVISQVFGMVDTMMLGNVPDSAPMIAAVGIATNPINLIVCVMTAFCIGTTAAIAWYTGAGEPDNARCAARQSLVIMTAAGLVLTAIAILFARPMMRFAGAKPETLDFAVSYYRLIAAGFFFQAITISVTASLRGIGVTRVPMLYNLASASVNVLFNYILIYGKLGFPAMGISGAALATTLSKIVAFLSAVSIFFFGRQAISYRRGDSFRPKSVILKRIFRVGITAGCEQLLLQSGAVLTTKVVATVPTVDFAANQIAGSIEGLAWQPGQACNAASTTCMGQALGEGRADKAHGVTMMIWCTSLCFGAVIAAVFLLFGEHITALYTPDSDIARNAARILAITASGLPGVCTHLPIAGALRGAGDTKTPLIASFCSLWIFRLVLSYLLIQVLGYGVAAARVAIAADQTVRGSINLIRYFCGGWVKRANTSKIKEH
ncbi:MAG: MATE family efflux transporter [Clostridia bacterium]|nr:MATE family efflux transporter [Clostridia bacterium]